MEFSGIFVRMTVRFIVLTLLFMAGCATSKNKQLAELHLQIGTGHLTKGHYPEAISELLEAEKLDPKNPIVQNNLGLAFFIRGRLDLAQNKLENALALDSKYSDARNNLGRVCIEKGEYKRAIKELQIVVQDLTYTFPEKASINLGIALFMNGDFSGAKDSLRTALKLERKSCVGLTYYGRSFLGLKQYELSVKALDQAIFVCAGEEAEAARYFSALAYYNWGQEDQAKARLRELIESAPGGKYKRDAESMLAAISAKGSS